MKKAHNEEFDLLQDEIDESCGSESGHRHGKLTTSLKANLVKRMNRIEGQVRGINGMIERDVYCDDILNQMSAVQSALNSVSRLLLESHMKSCVIDRLKEDDSEVIEEFMKTISKLMK